MSKTASQVLTEKLSLPYLGYTEQEIAERLDNQMSFVIRQIQEGHFSTIQLLFLSDYVSYLVDEQQIKEESNA